MKDPARLLDSEIGGVERAILRAGAEEAPSEAARNRLMAALGLPTGGTPAEGFESTSRPNAGSGTEASSAEPPAKAAPGKTTGTPASSQTAGASFTAASSKWSLMWWGAGGLGATFAAVMFVQHVLSGASLPGADAAPAPGAADGDSQPSALRRLPQRKAEAPREVRGGGGTRVPAPGDANSASDATSIAREIAHVDRIRALVQDGQPRAALRSLVRYDREHPGGTLQQEARRLRIEAWLLAGERSRAQALAKRFLKAHPDSPHAGRMREILEDTASAP